MGHRHVPRSHPDYLLVKVHEIPKADCDRVLREAAHYHPGRPCDMQIRPSRSKRDQMGSTPTCALEDTRKAEYVALMRRKVAGEEIDVCLACEYAAPRHNWPPCRLVE